MAFLLLVGTVLQSLVPASAPLGLAKAPFLLAVVLYYALTHKRAAVATVAIVAGLIQDSLSLFPVGYSALCFACFALAVESLRGVLFRDSILTVSALGAVLSALTVPVLYAMLLLGTDTARVPLGWLGLKMAGNALLGLLVAPAVWMVAAGLERQVGVVHSDDD